MKILVCGSREWKDKAAIEEVVKDYAKNTIWVIHGNAEGADKIAGSVAGKAGLGVIACTPPWGKLTLSAGPVRNRVMLDMKPDLVIAFHDDLPNSKGTLDCVSEANRRGVPVFLWTHATKKLETWRR